MACYVAGAVITLWVVLLDGDRAPITTAADSDFSESIDHEAADGTLTAATVGAWSHRNNGRYKATISNAVAGKYHGTVTYNGTPKQPFAFGDIEVLTAAQADPAAALSAVAITVTSPVNTAGDTIMLVRGDAYLNADGRAIAFTVTSPNLTGASATMTLKTYANATVLTKSMTVSGTTVRCDISAAETTAMTKGTPVYKYELIATLSSGSTATLAQGVVWVQD